MGNPGSAPDYSLGKRYNTSPVYEHNVHKFYYRIDAINIPFPPIFVSDQNQVIRFKMIQTYVTHSTHNHSDEAYSICSKQLIKVNKGDNLFKCSNQAYVSGHLLCDGTNDCGNDFFSDEIK